MAGVDPARVEHVWYVAYGSNLHGPRLQRYLDQAPNPRQPIDRRATTLPHRLFFAERSAVWGGGRAYVERAAVATVRTLATAWLVTVDQFHAVLAQENGAGAVDPLDRAADPYSLAPGEARDLGLGRYGLLLGCESPDHRPAITFTAPTSPTPRTEPSSAYVDVIVAGLMDGHGLAEDDARDYVAAHIR